MNEDNFRGLMEPGDYISCSEIAYLLKRMPAYGSIYAENADDTNATKYAIYDTYSRIDTVCFHVGLQPSHPYLVRDLLNFLEPQHYLGDDIVEAGKGIAKSIYSLFAKKEVPNRRDKEIRFKLYGSEYFCMGYTYNNNELIFTIRKCNYKF